jgi:hypothetical protein
MPFGTSLGPSELWNRSTFQVCMWSRGREADDLPVEFTAICLARFWDKERDSRANYSLTLAYDPNILNGRL